MKDKTKEEINEIIEDIVKLKTNNPISYWFTLGGLGGIATVITISLLKFTGLILLVIGAFIFILNNILMAWKAMKDAEKTANQTEEQKAEKQKTKRGNLVYDLTF